MYHQQREGRRTIASLKTFYEVQAHYEVGAFRLSIRYSREREYILPVRTGLFSKPNNGVD